LPPGRGTVPLAASLHRLRTTGYDGWLTLELNYDKTLHFGKPQDVVRDALALVRQAWTETGV
jgi:sugar phosphate isomerase/epimerase